MAFDDEHAAFSIVVNHEEQYSIWPADQVIPAGWQAVGESASKAECLSRINVMWRDMRPLSLRRQMDTGHPRSSREADAV